MAKLCPQAINKSVFAFLNPSDADNGKLFDLGNFLFFTDGA